MGLVESVFRIGWFFVLNAGFRESLLTCAQERAMQPPIFATAGLMPTSIVEHIDAAAA
jgi:hypothetical protein